MTLWAVTMVRDEMDILPWTLDHLVAEGVDALIVADNLSTDGTREWLHAYAAEAPIPVTVIHDDEEAYYQSEKMTRYYHQACAGGADWVIPFDADEVWHSDRGKTLAEEFAAPRDADCLAVKIHNYFPTSKDPVGEPVPFKRITNRDPSPAVLTKTAVRAGIDSLVIEQGNHGAHADQFLRVQRPEMTVAHFPWRGPEQFERKARNGAAAYNAATDTAKVPLYQGEHWRGYGRILGEGGSAALRDVYDEWFCDPPIQLEERPAPWRARSRRRPA